MIDGHKLRVTEEGPHKCKLCSGPQSAQKCDFQSQFTASAVRASTRPLPPDDPLPRVSEVEEGPGPDREAVETVILADPEDVAMRSLILSWEYFTPRRRSVMRPLIIFGAASSRSLDRTP